MSSRVYIPPPSQAARLEKLERGVLLPDPDFGALLGIPVLRLDAAGQRAAERARRRGGYASTLELFDPEVPR